MSSKILKLLSFRLSGRFAHFRKFYTNSSSLSYFIPPRTAVMGMLASVLQYERDSYYEMFSPESFKISVSVSHGTVIRKQMQSLNYVHAEYYNLLNGGKAKKVKAMHSQCKLELLVPEKDRLCYMVYVAAADEQAMKTLDEIESRLRVRDMGFGLYLGQRQFRADIGDLQTTDAPVFMAQSEHVDSVCLRENAELDVVRNMDAHILAEQMPIHLRKEKMLKKKGKGQTADPGRVLDTVNRVIYETSGKRMFGQFRNCHQVGEKTIAFYEG